AYPFAALHRLPVWLTHGTQVAMSESGKIPGDVDTRTILGRDSFAIGDLEVRPFTVPHDAREPVQFVLSDGAFRLGVLTDIGASFRTRRRTAGPRKRLTSSLPSSLPPWSRPWSRLSAPRRARRRQPEQRPSSLRWSWSSWWWSSSVLLFCRRRRARWRPRRR